MAVTTDTYTANAGWARTDVMDLLESAFTFAGLHGPAITGITTGIQDWSGGGTVGTGYTVYYDLPVSGSSGIGTGATFNVYRSAGNIDSVSLNRPGYNYVENEVVTIPPDNHGGSAAGATGIAVTIGVAGQGSPTSYGTASSFFYRSGDSQPFGVLRQVRDQSKKYGTTYRAFQTRDDYNLYCLVGSSFSPNTWNEPGSAGMYGETMRGTQYLDVTNTYGDRANSDYYYYAYWNANTNFRYATTSGPTTHDLKLNVYKSAIDTDFAVFSFEQPSISGSLTDSTFGTFIIHNYDNALWDYDEVFMSGSTIISPYQVANTNDAGYVGLNFVTYAAGNSYLNTNNICSRTAEGGYLQLHNDGHEGDPTVNYRVSPTQSKNIESYTSNGNAYSNYQGGTATIFSRVGDTCKDLGRTTSGTEPYGNYDPISSYKSVVKGIPMNGNMIPVPYYMPDDFVLIDLKLSSSLLNIRQGDTITISGSEIYTVITGSYNKDEETAGIFFCARTT